MRACGKLILWLLLSGPLLAAKPVAERPAASASLAKLAWLAGNWRIEKAGRVVEEQWMAPAGGVMLGMSRTVAKGKTLEFEFLQIREGPGGELFYVAQPSRQQEATFKQQAQMETGVVFENKTHDFPQVIGYLLRPDDTLLAFIEGLNPDGTTRRVEFIYVRVPR